MMNDYEDRFLTDFSQLNFLDEEGNLIPQEQMLCYLKGKITVDTNVGIGDVVKLKNTPYLVEIIHTDYYIPNIGIAEYAGRVIGDETQTLRLFNQYHIESIAVRKKKFKPLKYYLLKLRARVCLKNI